MIEIHVNLQGTYCSKVTDYLREDNLNIYYLVLFSLILNRRLKKSLVEFYFEDTHSEKVLGSNGIASDVIEVRNSLTGKYLLIDFRDSPWLSLRVLEKDDDCLAVFACMYNVGLTHITDEKLKRRYHPFFFFDQEPNLTESHFKKISNMRLDKVNLIPKMVFHGSIGDEPEGFSGFNYVDFNVEPHRPIRQIVRILKEKRSDLIDVFDATEKLSKVDWWVETSKYLLTLIVPGHPWCFREHECWALGIATIANTYTAPLPEPLIGNKHYVDCNTSGKTPMDVEFDAEKGADLIIKRFLEIRNNYDFISEVEINSRERYLKHSSVSPAANYMAKKVKSLLF